MKLLVNPIFLGGLVLATCGLAAFGQASSQPARGGQPLAPVLANPDRAPNELHVGVGQVGRPVTGDVSPPSPDKAMKDLGLMNPRLDPLGGSSGLPSGSGAFGTSGLRDFSLPNSLGDIGKTGDLPPLSQTTQPASVPDAAQPPAAITDDEITDKLFLQGWDKFHHGLYRECVDMLRNDVRAGQAGAESRLLYTASLVGTGQMSTAGFEAMRAAKDDPKNFFATARRLAKRYRLEPDFSSHFDAAKKNGRNAKSVELGILWALYQSMEGSEENDPGVTLALIRPGSQDSDWFATLANSLKKSPAK